jgi:hypothetical protein
MSRRVSTQECSRKVHSQKFDWTYQPPHLLKLQFLQECVCPIGNWHVGVRIQVVHVLPVFKKGVAFSFPASGKIASSFRHSLWVQLLVGNKQRGTHSPHSRMVVCQTFSKGSSPGNVANLSTGTNGRQPVSKQGKQDICGTYGDLARLCRPGWETEAVCSLGLLTYKALEHTTGCIPMSYRHMCNEEILGRQEAGALSHHEIRV